MDTDLVAISTAFVVIITALFTGFLKLLKELRFILNGASEKRAVTAATRHGEIKGEFQSMSKGIKDLTTTSEEQTDLLRTLVQNGREKK